VQKKRFNVEQIVAVLKQAEAGVPLAELIRRMGISEQTVYRWKKQYRAHKDPRTALRMLYPRDRSEASAARMRAAEPGGLESGPILGGTIK
jgi:putative transposase